MVFVMTEETTSLSVLNPENSMPDEEPTNYNRIIEDKMNSQQKRIELETILSKENEKPTDKQKGASDTWCLSRVSNWYLQCELSCELLWHNAGDADGAKGSSPAALKENYRQNLYQYCKKTFCPAKATEVYSLCVQKRKTSTS